MNDVQNLRDTIQPKSDQLNADDLMGTTKTLTVTAVKRGDTVEQPVIVHYEDEDGRPYKPCKSMRRVLVNVWGEDGRSWVGRAMTVYCDPEVKFGGVAVGGIRISHVSHIEKPEITMSLTVTKAKRKPFAVKRLDPVERPAYPAEDFTANLPKWAKAMQAGKLTPEQVIAKAEQKGTLTEDQRLAVREAGNLTSVDEGF